MTMILLKEWCDQNRPERSWLFTLVQEYRKWGKLKSTYIDGYMKYTNTVTGRIHLDIFALSTDTGRMNCQRPNCQNMPRKTNDPIGVRNFIKAPAGHLILSLDFSQIELRIRAFYCRDERMMETYRPGGDIHAEPLPRSSPESATRKHRTSTEPLTRSREPSPKCQLRHILRLVPKGAAKHTQVQGGD